MRTDFLIFSTVSAALTIFVLPTTAGPGDLDLTFGGGTGKVTTDVNGIPNESDEARAVAIQSDGKIVVAGRSSRESGSDFAVVRYQSDGALDTTFGASANGKVITSVGSGYSSGQSVAVQSDGKIVVAGWAQSDDPAGDDDFVVIRYGPNGNLDSSFNATGKVVTDFGGTDDRGYGVMLQRDGKIVVAGDSRNPIGGMNGQIAVARYNTDGSLDTTFSGDGKLNTAIGIGNARGESVALQSDGKILVAGWVIDANANFDFAVVRYNSNGSLDTDFDGDGIVTTAIGSDQDKAYDVVLQSDGKIVVAGFSRNATDPDIALVRYNTNGSLDPSFGGDGTVTTAISTRDEVAFGVVVDDDGKLVVAGFVDMADQGSDDNIALLRYNTDGTLDGNFGVGGFVTTDFLGKNFATSLALQFDGKIVVAEPVGSPWTKFALARYEGFLDADGDGLDDNYETGTGIYISPEDTGTSPTNPDSDADGLRDGAEVKTHGTDPNVGDTDGDGFLDGYEILTGKRPLDPLSKPALVADARTAIEFTFPSALGKIYRIESSTDLSTWTTVEDGIVGNGGEIQRFYSTRNLTKQYLRVEEEE